MRRISKREHVLLGLAIVVAAATGVYVPRIRPARMRIAALDEHRAQVEQQIRGVKWPRTPEDPVRLAAKRDGVRAEVEAAREALRRAEERFASRRGHALADGLRLEISALAHRHGVYFREDLSCPEVALRSFAGDLTNATELPDAARLVRFLALGEPYALVARQVTVETDFAGLRAFLRDLYRLDHRVLVLRFDITAGNGHRPGVTPLLATLVLVF